ncbi:hypothetical protein EO763_22190 [Pectobacterium odoriferum]|uniref:hypothetical protein n=1 Tax=Pectobacterium odoriferum TaxID=78398 RepID=UPI001373D140|nr:hypothetical protein [Pectobacterium odoriferum]QHP82375.1 hypothetical protein EO763_22190 [Pectobacterium odoriferum]
MKFKIIIGVFLSALSFSSTAVDGYKDVKFGADVNTVLAANLCSLKKNESGKIKGVESYYCTDFKFSGSDTLAIVFFLNGKFERLAINLNANIDAVASALGKRYGKPSSLSTPEEADWALANGGAIYIRYDNDTVFITAHRDASTRKDLGQLIYTSPSYANLMKLLQEKNLENDL